MACGPLRSRASSASPADSPPPALAPAMTIRSGSPPISPACFAVHTSPAYTSSTGAGCGFSGASRYSTDTTTASSSFAQASGESTPTRLFPMTMPPPWTW